MSQNDSSNTKPETAEPKVRRALEANPGATAARIATEAGVGRSTATKILSRWAAEGLVTRTTGKDQSVPVTWTIHDDQTNAAAAVAEPGEDVPATADQEAEGPAGDADERQADASLPDSGSATIDPAESGAPMANTPQKERLPKGGLYELVREFLQAHPGEEFGPAKIGTELVRSSGAVNNALEKLVTNGLATKTCEAPKRFTSG